MASNKKSVMPLPHERLNAKLTLALGIVSLVALAVLIILKLLDML